MTDTQKKVLVVDDDPSHLEIYGLLVQRAGYGPVLVQLNFSGAEPLPEAGIDLVLLDYRPNSVKTALELAQDMRAKYPGIKIVVLSDVWTLPRDFEGFADAFVRKGEPEELLKVMNDLFSKEEDASIPA